jgi:4'-phosphopantetheinyl transferase
MGDLFAHRLPASLEFCAQPDAGLTRPEVAYFDTPASPVIAVHTLSQNQVDLWFAPLDLPRNTQQAFESTLSDEEKHRASRFRFERLTSRYVGAHGWLRHLLGGYLEQPPETIDFVYGPKGKPALLPAANPEGIQFNMAHSDGLAAIVVTRAFRIGVDVELVRPIPDADDLVERFFSKSEAAVFGTLPVAERSVAFLNLWTRKEAWLKATGEGIAQLLNTVEVSFLPGKPVRFLSLPAGYAKPDAWSLFDASPKTGVIAAIAVDTPESNVRTRWADALPEVIL